MAYGYGVNEKGSGPARRHDQDHEIEFLARRCADGLGRRYHTRFEIPSRLVSWHWIKEKQRGNIAGSSRLQRTLVQICATPNGRWRASVVGHFEAS